MNLWVFFAITDDKSTNDKVSETLKIRYPEIELENKLFNIISDSQNKN